MKITILFIFLLSLTTYAQETKEKAPEFKGGKEALKTYLFSNFEYPDYETKEGVVVVEFRLGSYGYVYDVNIIKGISDRIDNAVHNLVYDMPSWNSARDKYGKRIETIVTLPIKVEKPKEEVIEIESTDYILEDNNKIIIYDVVAVSPEYVGGEKAMMKFIIDNFTYPDSAKINNEQGTIYVQFVVSEKGEINDIKVLKGVSSSLDKEALRVVSIMPNWKPGEQEGKPVNVRYILPIKARLN